MRLLLLLVLTLLTTICYGRRAAYAEEPESKTIELRAPTGGPVLVFDAGDYTIRVGVLDVLELAGKQSQKTRTFPAAILAEQLEAWPRSGSKAIHLRRVKTEELGKHGLWPLLSSGKASITKRKDGKQVESLTLAPEQSTIANFEVLRLPDGSELTRRMTAIQ